MILGGSSLVSAAPDPGSGGPQVTAGTYAEEGEPADTPAATETPAPEPPVTGEPTEEPTETPVPEPTDTPGAEPTETPGAEPTDTPGAEPTETPVPEPTDTPGAEPTETPTPEPTATATPTPTPVVEAVSASYRSYVRTQGWQDYVADGATSGTTGQKLFLEAVELKTEGVEGLGIRYRVHMSDVGWLDYASDGASAGQVGAGNNMEAIQIELTGEKAENYDVWYRVHSDKAGWLGWTRNGGVAGTTGLRYGMQALEVRIQEKDSPAPGSTEGANINRIISHYKVHVSKIGWQNAVIDGAMSGTTGQKLSIEAMQATVTGMEGVGIQYQAHVSDIGWMDPVYDGATAGTTGQAKPIEALKIQLTGEAAQYYDIWYRVHSDKVGWLGWAKNGQTAGTEGFRFGIQAVEIRVAVKDSIVPGSLDGTYIKKPVVHYKAYVANNGWQNAVINGGTAGTTGQKLSIEALQATVTDMEGLGIQYRVHVSQDGWLNYVSDGASAGTGGSGLQIEAVQFQLTGGAAQYYDIWYRVHSDKVGWLGWAKNGAMAGTTGFKYGAQAVQILVQAKDTTPPGNMDNAYRKNEEGWFYQGGYRRYKDKDGNVLNDVSSIFNPSSKYITVDRTRGLVTIYGYNSSTGSYDTPIKAMLCSVGNPISLTEAGTYSIGWQVTFKQMVGDDYVSYAPYVSQIYGAVYFHGVGSSTSDLQTVSSYDFNMLGTPQSHGCVRLAACDAKWIYYNVDSGTTVRIGDNLGAPMSGVRYAWTGGAYGPDPTYS